METYYYVGWNGVICGPCARSHPIMYNSANNTYFMLDKKTIQEASYDRPFDKTVLENEVKEARITLIPNPILAETNKVYYVLVVSNEFLQSIDIDPKDMDLQYIVDWHSLNSELQYCFTDKETVYHTMNHFGSRALAVIRTLHKTSPSRIEQLCDDSLFAARSKDLRMELYIELVVSYFSRLPALYIFFKREFPDISLFSLLIKAYRIFKERYKI